MVEQAASTLSSSTPCVPSVYTWSGEAPGCSAREAGPRGDGCRRGQAGVLGVLLVGLLGMSL